MKNITRDVANFIVEGNSRVVMASSHYEYFMRSIQSSIIALDTYGLPHGHLDYLLTYLTTPEIEYGEYVDLFNACVEFSLREHHQWSKDEQEI